ncbi:MFS transporter [Candidatus Woesearchaeota archaeon]|nr:MFS transporter [Candidatus Woesearchaeota archaeon]
MAEDNTKKSLKYSLYDGAAFAVMDGMTNSFLTPFAIALNASVNLIAALTYVPQLVGAFVQLFAVKIVEILKDRRKILVAASFMHAFLWIPLLLIPYLSPDRKYLVIAYVSLQTMLIQLMQPIGNSLLGDIVPKFERGRFFGLRNKVVGAASFIATLIAGFILNYFSPKNPFLGFAILFSLAFITRLISGVFKTMIYDPMPDTEHAEKFSLFDFVKRMDKTNYGHFVIYVVLFKFATYIAAPFFAVYMLRNLGFSYWQFTILAAAELIASFIAVGIWGKLIDERGTKFVLYISGMLTPLIPLLWLFSKNFYYLILVEIFSGLSWAGFNLSASNFIFDAVKPENRVRCIAYYKFFEGIAIVLGAALGGFLINHLPMWIFASTILLVFLISGALRLITSLTLLPTLKEARLIELDIEHSFFKRYLTIRPSEGIIFEVIGRYKKIKEKIKQTSKKLAFDKEKIIESGESETYNKKLMKFIGKDISPKKEEHELTDMHEIEHITEEIEKGKIKNEK